MQRWTRQSQCIFCQHRVILGKQTEPSHQLRHRSDLRKPASREKTTQRRDEAGSRRTRFQETWPSSTRDTIPDAGSKRDSRFNELKTQFRLKSAISRSLNRVKRSLQNSTMSATSEMSQLEGLDPDGSLWAKFESLVEESLDGSPDLETSTGYLGKLKRTKQVDADKIDKSVKFAFLDMVLDTRLSASTDDGRGFTMKYPTEWYPRARQLQRTIHLHVGPTNSGKTYNALKRLEQAKSGFYAGPLRLLAHEVFSRFNSREIKCNLITGDDVRLDNSGDVQLYSSTVEMVALTEECDVGVVDEIQMMGDLSRGWAWTRAVLGAQAKELHLCGEARVVPLVREIVASMGDTLHIHQYERLNPLKVMSRSLRGNLQNLRKGDCVVSFSIVNIHALKRQIEVETGKRCAIIYGGLPPETRAQQAALFNDPDNNYDFLAASDAIGMGLNLSIKRIVFEKTKKFNGVVHEPLSIPQIKQIAGRAGRYRTAQDDKKAQASASNNQEMAPKKTQNKEPKNIGLVTCLDEADLPILRRALASDGPPLGAAGILPTGEFYESLAEQLPYDTPFEFIMHRVISSLRTNTRFQICEVRDQTDIARTIDEVPDLSVADRLTFCASPASFRSPSTGAVLAKVVIALAKAVRAARGVTVADIQEIPLEMLDEPVTGDKNYLSSLEGLHRSLILFLWLSYRFPQVLIDRDMATRAKELCEENINTSLVKFSANPKLRQRLAKIKKSSEMLIDQAKAQGWQEKSTLIMNPDQTVEEIDAAPIDSMPTAQPALEEKVEVDGELDIGDDEVVRDYVPKFHRGSEEESTPDHSESGEPQQAGATA